MASGSERGLVVAAATAATAASGWRRSPRVVSGAAGATAAEPAAAAASADLVHLRRGVAQRGADFLDLQLHHGALLALAGLVRTLLEPPGHDHPGTPGERLGHVLRGLPPDVAAQEQRLAVLPFAGLAVEGARGGGDREARHRRPGRGEAQFRIGR